MPIYVCHDGNKFLITVDALNKQEAENITGLNAIETSNNTPWIGWTVGSEGFIPPPPLESWYWNGEKWVAPKPKPEENSELYYWNDFISDWKITEQDQPYPSWTLQEYTGNWIAPKPMPINYIIKQNEDGTMSVTPTEEKYVWNEELQDWKKVD